jgi:8-hydroxy-5-deazaflavin:NADPH oxidoreductase
VAKRAPRTRVVAAIPPFAAALANGQLTYDCGLAPSVFLCGDDGRAKELAEPLVADLGAHPIDAGPLAAARLAELAMMLLIAIAYAGVPRDIGLRLLESAPNQAEHVRFVYRGSNDVRRTYDPSFHRRS